MADKCRECIPASVAKGLVTQTDWTRISLLHTFVYIYLKILIFHIKLNALHSLVLNS